MINPGSGGDSIADEDIAGVKYQRVKLIDATVGATTPISSRPDALLRVATDPSSLFYDPFEAALDTTNTWTTGGTAPSSAVGTLTMNQGTVALTVSSLTSKPTFPTLGNMFNIGNFVATFDSALKTGCYRFLGYGVAQGSPTVAAPIVNGVGFELASTDGVLSGVVWSNGVRTQSVVLTTQPLDTANHRYLVYYRTSRAYFEVDGVVGGSIAYPNPQLTTLPILALAVNGASTVSPAAVMTASFAGCGDTSHNNGMISDPTFPWRKAKVDAAGALTVKSGIVQQVSSSLTAAAQAQTITLQGEAALAVQIAGTWVGTVTFEASNDNTNWSTVNAQRAGDNTITQTVSNTAGDDLYRVGVAGFLFFRTRCSAYTSGTIVVTTSTASAASTAILSAPLPAGTNAIGTVAQATLTKGTQGTTGVATQDLHNSGRNVSNLFMAVPILTTTAEVMMSLTGYKSGAAVTATATPAVVTAGKTLRIERVIITYIAATVIGSVRVNMRALSSGVAVIGSPLVQSWQVGIPAIFTAGSADTFVFDYPEGLEFAAGFGVAISIQGFGAVPTTGTIVGYAMVALEGYEY